MKKYPKLADVENLRPLNDKNAGAFLLLYRQSVVLALKEKIGERIRDPKNTERNP